MNVNCGAISSWAQRADDALSSLLAGFIGRWRHKAHSSLIRSSANTSAVSFNKLVLILFPFLQEESYASIFDRVKSTTSVPIWWRFELPMCKRQYFLIVLQRKVHCGHPLHMDEANLAFPRRDAGLTKHVCLARRNQAHTGTSLSKNMPRFVAHPPDKRGRNQLSRCFQLQQVFDTCEN